MVSKNFRMSNVPREKKKHESNKRKYCVCESMPRVVLCCIIEATNEKIYLFHVRSIVIVDCVMANEYNHARNITCTREFVHPLTPDTSFEQSTAHEK